MFAAAGAYRYDCGSRRVPAKMPAAEWRTIMAEKITVYQCPACTGPLKFDGNIGKLKCEYCGSTYTAQEIEALYADKNKSAAAADAEAHKKAAQAEAAAAAAAKASGTAGSTDSVSGWGSDAAHMRAYNCTTCGAELICDETTAATSCPYCGNPSVIPGKFAGVDRPDYVIPFKGQEEGGQLFQRILQRKTSSSQILRVRQPHRGDQGRLCAFLDVLR